MAYAQAFPEPFYEEAPIVTSSPGQEQPQSAYLKIGAISALFVVIFLLGLSLAKIFLHPGPATTSSKTVQPIQPRG